MIIISVDSDDEEATVRGVLAEAGLSFTIRRGHVYVGGGGSGGWAPAVTAGGGCIGFGGGASADSSTVTINAGGSGSPGGGAVGFGGANTIGRALRPCCNTDPGSGHRVNCLRWPGANGGPITQPPQP